MRVITSPQTGIVDILRPGWSSELGADYQKQSRALVIVFRCKARLGWARLTQARILWLRATHAIWAARRAGHEKKCASHKLDVDIPRVLKIKLG